MKYVIFDLDDTLFYEIDFLKSAYYFIARYLGNSSEYQVMIDKYRQKENVFEYLSKKYDVEIMTLLNLYRAHLPNISLNDGVIEVLEFCKQKNYFLGIITDGRSLTQKNKIKALGIESYFDKVIISEDIGSDKPNPKNYELFIRDNIEEYFYIGDNFNKDFITPNKLGWKTVGLLDKGKNIHKQSIIVEKGFFPMIMIKEFKELLGFIV